MNGTEAHALRRWGRAALVPVRVDAVQSLLVNELRKAIPRVQNVQGPGPF
jgi:hypothetical protein